MSQNLNLSTDDLKEMIAAAVSAAVIESRKPEPPTEQQIAQVAMAQEHREQTAASLLAQRQNERNMQLMCVHEHSKQSGGGTHCVWVREEDPRSPGFILCQKCQGRVRPGSIDPKGLPCQRDRGAIYDTDLFNKLFQECGEQALMG